MVPQSADPATRAEWERLANSVRADLRAAGLPAHRLSGGHPFPGRTGPGVHVDVDPYEGVVVGWSPPRRVKRRAVEALEASRTDDPAITRVGRIRQVMRDAVAALLTEAGYVVQSAPETSYDPLDLYVRVGPRPLDQIHG